MKNPLYWWLPKEEMDKWKNILIIYINLLIWLIIAAFIAASIVLIGLFIKY